MTSEGEDELQELQEELKALEGLGELGESGKSDYGSPILQSKDNIIKFFKEMVNLKESWKVGNLREEEIGKSRLGVRAYLELSQYAKAEGLDLVSEYFTGKADIVAAPTLGRKGFFLQTVVTNIKKEQKIKEPSQKKKGLFSGGGNKDEEQ